MQEIEVRVDRRLEPQGYRFDFSGRGRASPVNPLRMLSANHQESEGWGAGAQPFQWLWVEADGHARNICRPGPGATSGARDQLQAYWCRRAVTP